MVGSSPLLAWLAGIFQFNLLVSLVAQFLGVFLCPRNLPVFHFILAQLVVGTLPLSLSLWTGVPAYLPAYLHQVVFTGNVFFVCWPSTSSWHKEWTRVLRRKICLIRFIRAFHADEVELVQGTASRTCYSKGLLLLLVHPTAAAGERRRRCKMGGSSRIGSLLL